MTLTTKQKQQFKGLAHHLKPVILIGNHGLSDAVQLEISRALDDHELIKVRIPGTDREARQQIIQTICQHQKADLVQAIGHISTFYRKNPER